MENYPAKFSPEARAAVEAELIRAVRLHDKRKREWNSDWSFPEGQSLQTCILSVFLVYAREAIELGKKGVWPVDQVRAQALEGLRLVTLEIGFKRDHHTFIERNGGSITPETQREFEATTEWHQFEDELLALAEPPQSLARDDASSQVSLPELSESTTRKLELKWSDLLDKYHLSGEHLRWHHRARLRRDTPKRIDTIGIAPSVAVAEHRFTDLAYTYWSIWNPSAKHEVFVGWLDAIKRRTSSEVEAVWAGKSDPIDRWYERMGAPAIEKELNTRVREWTKKARAAELAYLERYSKTAAAAAARSIEDRMPGITGTNTSTPAGPRASAPASHNIGLTLEGTLPDWEETAIGRKTIKASQQPQANRSDGGAPKSTVPVLSLQAHRRDQKRRAKAIRDLKTGLQGYFATLTRRRDIELAKVAEIIGAYAREIYDSTAENYLAIPSLDLEGLFGEAGPLNIGPTLSEVQKCLSTLRVRRSWKHSGDLLDDGYESMQLYLDEPWLCADIRAVVVNRAHDLRKEYQSRLPSAFHHGSPAGSASRPKPTHRRGPSPDIEIANQIACVVEQAAAGAVWRERLEDICEALDAANIPYPKTWKKRPYRSWEGCAHAEPQLVLKVIAYRLKQATDAKKTPA